MRYALSRLIWLPIVLWAVASLTFLVLHLIPGDPLDALASQMIPAEQIAQLRTQWGLDRPLWQQYVSFMDGLAHADLGIAISSGVPVEQTLSERVPPTIELAVAALILSTIIGVGAGIVSSTTRSIWLDYLARGFAVVGLSVPWFWLAIVLIIIFSVRLGWTPVGGQLDAGMDYEPITHFMMIDTIITGNWAALGSFLRHLALPTLAISLSSAGAVARMTRTTMLEVLRADYVRAARARGLRERSVVLRHALRNALLPVLTLQGLQFGVLLGGAVITEIVFAWPGVGRMLLDGILKRDYPIVQGTVIVIAFFYVVVNLIVDLLYHVVDPRLRHA